MTGLLLEPGSDTNHPPGAVPSLAQLHQEVAALRAEVAGLRRENLELRHQAGYWKGMHAQACRRLAELQQDVAQLRGENRQLQAQQFGRPSERQSRQDRSNELDDPAATPSPPVSPAATTPAPSAAGDNLAW